MNQQDSIKATKEGFEESFLQGDFYNKQTQDQQHLESIISFLPIKSGMKILDLGVGSGFLSFAIAKKYQNVQIIGLDIVEMALEKNRERAEAEGLCNLSFVSYDGIDFPFKDCEFDLVMTRYALHHFPDIQKSIGEVSRVLKNHGSFFISDPRPNDDDTERFVDAYMQLKKDGHIKFYTKKEWCDICSKASFNLYDSFDSEIRFPKKRATAYGFDELLKHYSKNIIDGYHVEITDDEIYISEKVNNILFVK